MTAKCVLATCVMAMAVVTLSTDRCVAGIEDNLIAHWCFEGDASDCSGNGHDGQESGDVYLCDGACETTDSAYCFEGYDDYVQVPYHADFDLVNEVSIAAWVRRLDLEVEGPILTKGTGPDGTANYECLVRPSGQLRFSFWAPGWQVAESQGYIMDQLWHHVAVTYDRASMKLYIDGELDSSTPNSTPMAATANEPVWIGLRTSGGPPPFVSLDGAVDEVRIYDRALTSEEVGELSSCAPFDSDGDGVPDDDDECPESDLNPEVIIDGCETGVENQLLDDGCTMSDLIVQCAEDSVNHGACVRCVSHLTNLWKCQGFINGAEKGAIMSCTAQAELP